MATRGFVAVLVVFFVAMFPGVSHAGEPGPPDLTITKVDSPDPVLVGANITYTMTVTNGGPGAAQSVELSDPIPADTTFVSFTAPAGWTIAVVSDEVTATNPSVAAAASHVFTMVVSVDVDAPIDVGITNTATVSAESDDPNPADNSDTELTSLTAPDLTITKVDSPDPVLVGANITYTMTVTNAGPGAAQSVELSDLVPADTSFVSFTAPAGWTIFTPPGEVTATNFTIAQASSHVFTMVVSVDVDAPIDVGITNTATVSAESDDPNPADNSDTELTSLTAPDLTITKVDSPDPVLANEILTYTVTVTNSGPGTAQGVELSDPIPGGTTFVSATAPAGWTLTTPAVGSTGTISATLPSLAAGLAQVFTFALHVDFGAPSLISNTATISAASDDPTPGDNADTETTAVVGSIGTSAPEIPTLSGAALAMLSAVLALCGAFWLRRGR